MLCVYVRFSVNVYLSGTVDAIRNLQTQGESCYSLLLEVCKF